MIMDVALFVLILIFAIPLGMVLVILINNDAHFHQWVGRSGIGLVFGLSILLLIVGEGEVSTALTFMGEAITFSISNTAIILFLSTLVVLGWVVWRHAQDEEPAMSPYQWLLLCLSLSFAFIAFISGQFMIRYIALDMVGLFAALSVLNTFSATWGLRHFILIFQILRFGDLSLLASILLINRYAETLEISQMIPAAVEMPADAQVWVFLGFLLALLVKMAIWPFSIWLKRSCKAAPRVTFWISGIMVPVLGFYLLYRIIPILNSNLIFQNIILISVVVLGFLVMGLTTLQVIKFDRFTHVGGVMNGFLLAAVVLGGSPFLLYYLVGLILHRWLLFWAEGNKPSGVSQLISLWPLVLNGLFIGLQWRGLSLLYVIGWLTLTALTIIWDLRMGRIMATRAREPVPLTDSSRLREEDYGSAFVSVARWLNRTLEVSVLTQGLMKFGKVFHRLADWVYHNIEHGFERLWMLAGHRLVKLSEGTVNIEQNIEDLLLWISRKLLAVSEETLHKVEEGAAQSSGQLMDEALHALENYEKNVLKKALRWDLAWIPFLLVVILVMLFVL